MQIIQGKKAISETFNQRKQHMASSNPQTQKKAINQNNLSKEINLKNANKKLNYSFDVGAEGKFDFRKKIGPVTLAIACSGSMGGLGYHYAQPYDSFYIL